MPRNFIIAASIMTSFSFNFQIDPNDTNDDADNNDTKSYSLNKIDNNKVVPTAISNEISLPLKKLSLENDELPVCEDGVVATIEELRGSAAQKHASVSYYCPEEVSLWARVNQLMPVSIEQHSDLVSGVYEGGFQLWECSEDLARWLLDSSDLQPDLRVIELGCGAGLPALSCLRRHRPSKVAFQDFNSEVLRAWTMPNCRLNLAELESSRQLQPTPELEFLAGSWASLADAAEFSEAFDLLLTAETIYNPAYYEQLHDALNRLLTPDGVALVAAKVGYFGVGGSESLFCEFLDRRSLFAYSTVMRTESAALARVILRLRRKR